MPIANAAIHRSPYVYWLRILYLFSITFVVNADSSAFEKQTMRVGFFLNSFPYISRTDAEVGLKYWGEQPGKSQNIESTVDLYDDIHQLHNDFVSGKINFIVASPAVIVTEFDRSLLAEGFTVSKEGSTSQNLVVITRKNANLNSFKDLAGKKVGLLTNDLIAEYYLDYLSLANFQKPYKEMFITTDFESKRSQLVYDLFFKKIDAIIFYEASYQVYVELNPQIKEETQIISNLSDINSGIGLFHKKVPADFRKKIISKWLALGSGPGDQYLLKIFQADKFENADVTTLQTVENFLNEYRYLLNSYLNHKK